jgi:hypothetical protein
MPYSDHRKSNNFFRTQVLSIAFAVVLALQFACGGSGSLPATSPSDSQGTVANCDYQTDTFVNIAGTYSVEGGKTDQSGGNYSGEAVITQISGNCFRIEWHIDGRTRIGAVPMVGNIIGGTWQEGGKSGLFSGVANDDGSIALSWGVDGGDSTEYSEMLIKK